MFDMTLLQFHCLYLSNHCHICLVCIGLMAIFTDISKNSNTCMLKILLKYCNKFNFGWLCPEVFSQIKPQSFITAAEQGPVHIFNIRLELVTTFISSNKCLYSWLDLKIFNTNHSVYEISSQLHDSLKVMNFPKELFNFLSFKQKDFNFPARPLTSPPTFNFPPSHGSPPASCTKWAFQKK